MKDVKVSASKNYRESLITGLKDPQESAAFIEAILEEKDSEPELLRAALEKVAEALGEAMPPEQAQQHLEKLDRLLPNSESLLIYDLANWLDVLGLKLTVTVK